jgi:hypothetical protein
MRIVRNDEATAPRRAIAQKKQARHDCQLEWVILLRHLHRAAKVVIWWNHECRLETGAPIIGVGFRRIQTATWRLPFRRRPLPDTPDRRLRQGSCREWVTSK